MGVLDRFRRQDAVISQMTEALAIRDHQVEYSDDTGNRLEQPDPLQAQMNPIAAYDFTTSVNIATHDEDWQRRYRRYDREGPGIVGAASNIPALTSTLVTWHVQVRNKVTQEWEDARADAVAMATLRLFAGERAELEDLVRKMVRTLDGPGEFIGIRDMIGGRNVYTIGSKSNITINANGSVEYRTRPNAPKGSKFHRYVSQADVMHVFNEDEEWPGLPTSPFQRVLPDLEMYRLIIRSMGRHFKSKLLMNGVMWAEATNQATSWPQKFKSWGEHSIRDRDDADVRSMIPFPLNTAKEPKWIRVGAPLDASERELADWFLMSYARGTDLPQKMLLEGPGDSNHWGDFVINDYYADFVMWPRCVTVARILTHWVLRPWGHALSMWGDRDPEDYRVWFDLTKVRTRTDNTERILSIPDIATRQARAEAAGLTPDQVYDLPPGVTEAEWHAAMSGANLKRVLSEENEPVILRPGEQLVGGVAGEQAPPDDTGVAPDRGDTPATDDALPEPPIAAQLENGSWPTEEWDRDADLILT